MIACVAIPRFTLLVACGGEPSGPAALAPPQGARAVLGEVSRAAEVEGVKAGMALGEALGRCPTLRLIPADPLSAAERWERVIAALEGIGAAVESGRAGTAFFLSDGLRGLYRDGDQGVLRDARRAVSMQVSVAAAPGRFAALLAASRGGRIPRAMRGNSGEVVIPERALSAFLGPHPIGALRRGLDAPEREVDKLLGTLERLGLRTLGALAALPAANVADRFGELGLAARRLARGEETPLRPRQRREELEVELELPEGAAGGQLDYALALLVEQLLASPRRKERTLLSVGLSARLSAGGSWAIEQGFGRPCAAARTMVMLLTPRLAELPGPIGSLRLRALACGPPAAAQLELSLGGEEPRRARLAAALREVRAAAGHEALLRVVELDGRARAPEQRFALAPLQT